MIRCMSRSAASNAGRPYWYRFTSGDGASRIGRAMTAPAADAPLDRLRFGFVSCSNYELGYFSAYRHLADEQPDVALFLGDYIYEYRRPSVPACVGTATASRPATLRDLSQSLCAIPRRSGSAAAARRSAGADDLGRSRGAERLRRSTGRETFDDPAQFLQRRAAAYRAFYEHMPVRPSLSHPNGPLMRVYDRFAFGDLVEISVLDGRQYRSRQACYAPPNNGGGHLETNAQLSRAARCRALDARVASRKPGSSTALARAQGAMERDRPGRADGGAARDAADGERSAIGPMIGTAILPAARGSCTTSTSRRCTIRSSSAAISTPSGRTICRLDFDDPTLADRRDRIRRHVDHVLRAALRPLRRASAEQSAREILREPQARLRLRRARPRADAGDVCTSSRMRHDPKADIATLKTFAVESGRPGAVEA